MKIMSIDEQQNLTLRLEKNNSRCATYFKKIERLDSVNDLETDNWFYEKVKVTDIEGR